MDSLHASRYALLRTYRRDGRGVDTPIWFHLDGDTLVFRTKLGPKTTRIANNPRVELRVCDYKGRVPDSARTLTGQATLLSGGEAEAANRLLHKRYGWQYNLVPLLPLPGVNNVDAALPWREKWQRVRNPNLWPGSAIVQVQLGLE
ncbi:PPOX class F420-dependent oxidoreductase [Mycobacterium crocinum]|uniref:PPOX class F420-dependent oxidoreductase n=1 Tax=Mycolicibacterium crocinum TaxID=388459 RepID=A0ABY3TVT8_9MYCO|nr:PPOX class F420-dependent oxidoreductase [Mycolicibacterium crocinum]MCV7215263.1 PPOX class F420-dependent oxidoreductase [Mycolicibacterium crocinum]ULN44159.1 PPOX class F420-dependent oxidoreductase [Mycolicibacterium crocinum]